MFFENEKRKKKKKNGRGEIIGGILDNFIALCLS